MEEKGGSVHKKETGEAYAVSKHLKAKQTSFEAMHCLTIALLNILSVTVDKRRDSNYKEEIRLFSALCRWQMETGGRLFLMVSLEEEQKQMYERHFHEMKTVTERTKNSF